DVVAHDVALRQPRLREEELVLVRDCDVVAADSHCARLAGMRKLLVLLLLALSAGPALAANCPTVSQGTLTVGTDNPAYPPWFGGKPFPGSPWKVSDPRSGEGYEAAVAYAVATQLGFKSTNVVWKYVPFNKAFAPGKKPFDLDINQISYTPAPAKVVSFSN